MAVVGFAVVACVCQELLEGHAAGRCARQRWKVGEVAAWPGPDPLRQQDLRRDPHGEGPLQPAALHMRCRYLSIENLKTLESVPEAFWESFMVSVIDKMLETIDGPTKGAAS